MLDAIARSGEGSFLAVLKTFGDRQPAGLLSFPREGVTLALDFRNRRAARRPCSTGSTTSCAQPAAGSIRPRMRACRARCIEAGYPGLAAFAAYRDPGMSSAMSRRLMGS